MRLQPSHVPDDDAWLAIFIVALPLGVVLAVLFFDAITDLLLMLMNYIESGRDYPQGVPK